MSRRRLGAAFFSLALVTAACGSGGPDLDTQPPPPVPPAGGAAQANLDVPVASIADLSSGIETATGELETVNDVIQQGLAQLDASCDELDPATVLNRPSAELSHRTFTGPDAMCAQLPNSSFVGAVIEKVDVSRANFAGADLSGARLQVVAIGADFTGANLQGADFTGSDLTGAIFNSADLTGSVMTGLVGGGLAGADLSNAVLGCNQLAAGPAMNFTNVTFDDTCPDRNIDGHQVMTLSGTMLGARAAGLDFTKIFVETTDFRLADLSAARLADYGVLPAGLDFSGALLQGADLSRNLVELADFTAADLTGALLTEVEIEKSTFDGADLTNADLSGAQSENNRFQLATIVGTNFSNASLSWDDFSGATFESVVSDGATVVAIVCEDKTATPTPDGNAARYYGLCTSGGATIL